MFKRRRKKILNKILGMVIFLLGFGIFLYIIPISVWIIIFAFFFMLSGLLLYFF